MVWVSYIQYSSGRSGGQSGIEARLGLWWSVSPGRPSQLAALPSIHLPTRLVGQHLDYTLLKFCGCCSTSSQSHSFRILCHFLTTVESHKPIALPDHKAFSIYTAPHRRPVLYHMRRCRTTPHHIMVYPTIAFSFLGSVAHHLSVSLSHSLMSPLSIGSVSIISFIIVVMFHRVVEDFSWVSKYFSRVPKDFRVVPKYTSCVYSLKHT